MIFHTTSIFVLVKETAGIFRKGERMADQNRMIKVTGRDGLLGWIDPQEQPKDSDELLIRLSNGQVIITPSDLLEARGDGSYHLPLDAGQFEAHRGQVDGEAAQTASREEEMMVIPVIAEKALVGKKLLKNRIRVTKRVREREELIDTPGFREELDIQHVPVNQVVEKIPGVRQEGETTIIPLLEEVLVVEKRILLKEEVHITLKRHANEPQRVSLRYEEVEVERARVDGEPAEPVENRAEKERNR
jgi:stress response protein YsnF